MRITITGKSLLAQLPEFAAVAAIAIGIAGLVGGGASAEAEKVPPPAEHHPAPPTAHPVTP